MTVLAITKYISINWITFHLPGIMRLAQTNPSNGFNAPPPAYGYSYGGWAGWWWWILVIVALFVVVALIASVGRGARNRLQRQRTSPVGPIANDGTGAGATAGDVTRVGRRRSGGWAYAAVAFIIIIGLFMAGIVWWGGSRRGPASYANGYPYGNGTGVPNGPGYNAVPNGNGGKFGSNRITPNNEGTGGGSNTGYGSSSSKIWI